ncbi:MAG: immune inhibitor A, partial [Chloroflexota bacterium]|nr:immune inhibitor A [Chloroflexota bacterium]
AHYGAAYLFLAYLYDRFGSGLIREMLADSRYTDFALVNDALGKEGIRQTADGLFKQWVVANVLRNPSIDGGVYRYPQMQGKIAVKSISAPFTLSSQLHPYASKYLVLAPTAGKPLHLTFKALTSVPLVHLTQAGPFWWGNRGDMSATSLERSVDLSHVRHATLTFSTAYNIEKDYDYAYVEASTDGGITWATLRGSHTTTSNPNGASYGNAYTGVDRPGGGEVQDHIDLSRYGGRRILLRFQYVTDDEYTGEGIILRNIAIPQIGWHDDFTGWQLHGFVPVFANTLPAQWHVQLIEYTTHRPRVAEIPLTGDHGTMTLDPGRMGLKKLVVAIYFTAPKTTVPSTYRVSVTTGTG